MICGSTMALSLMHDAAVAVLPLALALLVDQVHQAERSVVGPTSSLPVARLAAMPGEQVEEVGHVGAQLRVGRQQAQVARIGAPSGL